MKRLPVSRYAKTVKYAMLNGMSREHKYPLYASFKVTGQCKLRCSFCDVWRQRNGKPELQTREVLSILDNLADSSVLVVSFEGGEPFLREDICELLAYAAEMPYFTELTTSGVGVDFDRIRECVKYLDFLHVSIDEGHRNLHLFDELPRLKRWVEGLGVQIVVRDEDLPALEEKVRRVHEVDAKAIIMPAAHLDGTPNSYPDPELFRSRLLPLIEAYPRTIVTAEGYLDAINRPHSCDTSSVIIGPDGTLFYPCRIRRSEGTNLLRQGLMDFLSSEKAASLRREGRSCDRSCGWYQYFAVSSYYSPRTLRSSLRPYLQDILTMRGGNA